MNANIIYTIFFFILPIRKSALLPLKIKMKDSTVSPTVLFFMPFSPAFPPLPCASRKGGRAAARRPLYLHNSSVNRANSCKFNASPRIVSGQPQAVIAASISSFEKCSSSEFFSPFASVFRL